MSKFGATPATGLAAGLAGVARNAIGLLLTRMELVALELSEAINHLLKLGLIVALALVAAWFAIACGTALIIYLSWASLEWKILLIMALVFSTLAVGMLLFALSMSWLFFFCLSVSCFVLF